MNGLRNLLTVWMSAAWLVAGASLVPAAGAWADTIAVIGTGFVGSALGPRLAEAGHEVIYGSRDPSRQDVADLVARTGESAAATTPAEAARRASIVVLALPWNAVEDVVRDLGDLSGKIIIDPTNPRTTAEDGYRDYPFDSSNAERIQRLAPGAIVVKAFNTLAAATMSDPTIATGPVTVPIVGDDADAKRTVAAMARAIGLEAIDVGPLRHARIVEGLHYLRFNAVTGPINYHFRPERN
jgi:8-hydroxy-5-deazaflavin:NADPH oxidoreductase